MYHIGHHLCSVKMCTSSVRITANYNFSWIVDDFVPRMAFACFVQRHLLLTHPWSLALKIWALNAISSLCSSSYYKFPNVRIFGLEGVFLHVTEKSLGTKKTNQYSCLKQNNSTDWDLSKSPLPFPRKNHLSSPLTMFLWNIHIWVSDGGARGATERMKPFKVADQDFQETTN